MITSPWLKSVDIVSHIKNIKQTIYYIEENNTGK